MSELPFSLVCIRGCSYSTDDPLEIVSHMVQFVHNEDSQQDYNAMRMLPSRFSQRRRSTTPPVPQRRLCTPETTDHHFSTYTSNHYNV